MSDREAEIERLDVQLEGLENSLATTANMSAVFQQSLEGMKASILGVGSEATGLSKSLTADLRSSFNDLIFEGAKLSDVMKNLVLSTSETVFKQAMKPVSSALSGFVSNGISNFVGSLLPFEKGGVFSQGQVTPYAKGGVVSNPTYFPMRSGAGLMGEAGPEAIMPLARGPDGSLGVRGGSGGSVTVNMNIQASDVTSFKRSSSQIAANMQRAISRGQRNS